MQKNNFKYQSLIKNDLSKPIKQGVEFFKNKYYFPTANVNGFDIANGLLINYENKKTRANMQPKRNSIWFAKMKNSLKHIILPSNAKWFVNNAIFSTGFFGIECNEESFEYITSFIIISDFEKRKDALSNGATQQGVGNSELEKINILIPDKQTLNKYHSFTKDYFRLFYKNIEENMFLEKLRDFLLPLLMNGQVSIKD